MPFAFPGQSIVTRGGQRVVVPGDLFSPFSLGTLLLGWWDAEAASTLTLASGAVASWNDKVAAYALAQGTAGLRPGYSATNLNGRPSASGDGTDDYLEMASQPFPSGSAGSELWLLVRQDALAADTTNRVIFGYGAGNNTRYIIRRVVSGVNRAGFAVGNGTAAIQGNDANVDFTGVHVVRLRVEPTQSIIYVDGVANVPVAVVPSTDTSRVRMFANPGTLGNYANSGVNSAIVTSLLTDDQAAQLTAYLKQRGGIS